MAGRAPTKSLRFVFVLALTFACLASLHAAAASARPGPGAPEIDANEAMRQASRGLAEEEEELPAHLGGSASSANSVKLDKTPGSTAEEEEGYHWAMGGTTNDRAGSNSASSRAAAADRAAEPAADSKSGGGYFGGWTKGLSNSFSSAGRSITNGFDTARHHAISATNSFAEGIQDSAEAARDAAVYVANNPGKTLRKSLSDAALTAADIAHETITANSHEALMNAGAGFAVGGVPGALLAGGGTYLRGAHAAAMRKMGKIGSGVAVVPSLPVLEHAQP